MKIVFFTLLFWTVSASPVHSTELVFTFKNPAFGGNPLNGTPLLNNAQAQNSFEGPSSSNAKSSLEKFNESLQRTILSRLSSNVARQIIGTSGELIPGSIETIDFVVDIVDSGGGLLTITTTDKLSGDSTSFTVDNGF